MEKEVYQKAKDYALYLLTFRNRSKFELRQKLIKKGYSQDIVNKVIDRLVQLHYLNDEKFAEMWVNYRLNNYPKGRYLIKRELEEKGLSAVIINSTLDRLITEEIEVKIGVRLAKKWLKRHKGDQQQIFKLKIYLQNKGISRYLLDKIIGLFNLPERK